MRKCTANKGDCRGQRSWNDAWNDATYKPRGVTRGDSERPEGGGGEGFSASKGATSRAIVGARGIV